MIHVPKAEALFRRRNDVSACALPYPVIFGAGGERGRQGKLMTKHGLLFVESQGLGTRPRRSRANS